MHKTRREKHWFGWIDVPIDEPPSRSAPSRPKKKPTPKNHVPDLRPRCTVDGCDNVQKNGLGWCRKHWSLHRRRNSDEYRERYAASRERARTADVARGPRVAADRVRCTTEGCNCVPKNGLGWCKRCWTEHRNTNSDEYQARRRALQPGLHGTRKRYDKGCRCDDCRRRESAYRAEWRLRTGQTRTSRVLGGED
jgi:hypothetical protein